ncbi:MAG: MBL fold metallo-hydrolase [Rhodocyclaceae bacterium]
MSLSYRIVPVTAFMQNCSILWCDERMEAAVVDPGGDVPKIEAALAGIGARLTRVLLTHGHIDHAGAAAEVAERFGVPIEGPHEADRFWIDKLADQSRMFGLPEARPFEPTRWLAEGDTVEVGNQRLAVLHCPGHTPGHVVFHHAPSHLAVVGDVLFAGSIGRTDFPLGDHAALIGAIRGKLWPLGDDVDFIPGHGPMSSFRVERATNPFVGDRAV